MKSQPLTHQRSSLPRLFGKYIGEVNLNIGCGHNIEPAFINIDKHGDPALLDYVHDLETGLPKEIASDSVDLVFSSHVMEHIRNLTGLMRDCHRVLKPGGEALITVWNRWQPRFWFSRREVAVPWRKRSETLYRYYYLFSYTELEKLAKQAGFQILKSFPESYYHFPFKIFSRNICLLVKKDD